MKRFIQTQDLAEPDGSLNKLGEAHNKKLFENILRRQEQRKIELEKRGMIPKKSGGKNE